MIKEERFICEICSASFADKDQALECENHHPEPDQFKVSKVFYRKENRVPQHAIITFQGKSFACDVHSDALFNPDEYKPFGS